MCPRRADPEWIVELVRATTSSPAVAVGASVRGGLALEQAARW